MLIVVMMYFFFHSFLNIFGNFPTYEFCVAAQNAIAKIHNLAFFNHITFSSYRDSSQHVITCSHNCPDSSLIEPNNGLDCGLFKFILHDKEPKEGKILLNLFSRNDT